MYIIINEDEKIKNFVIDCRDVLKTNDMAGDNVGAYVQSISKDYLWNKDEEKSNKFIIEKLNMGGTMPIKNHFRKIVDIFQESNSSYALTIERFLHNLMESESSIKVIIVPKNKNEIFIGSPLWRESTQIVKVTWHGENNLVRIRDWGIMPLKSAKIKLEDNFILAATHEELKGDIETDFML